MAAGAVQPLNPVRWLAAPALACAGGAIILAAPVEALGLRLPEPVFALIPAFAWAIIRPSILAPWTLLLLGLFQDLLWGNALGLWPLALLLAYGLTCIVRPALSGQSFWTLWAWFLAAITVAFALAFALTWVMAREAADLVGLGLQAAATALLFPLAWRLIDAFEDADIRFK
jgi:rod shape-determining protein MreD